MPNFSGIWSVAQQMQARGQNIWPNRPGAPTIGTATAGNAQVSVAFTAPACAGYPATISGYQAISTPGCITATGASSPVVVTGLTNCTAYTFRVRAQNSAGYGAYSGSSNSATPVVPATSISYTTAGTYSWVAPTGVTSVAVLTIGAGAGNTATSGTPGGGGGGLRYKNNITVTPGNSYTVVVGARGTNGGNSYFCSTSVVWAQGGQGTAGGTGIATGGTIGGGNGGSSTNGGGGGAGGYAGAGGNGAQPATAGAGGGGGGGFVNGGVYLGGCSFRWYAAGGGGGVGIYGQGCNGAAASGGSGVYGGGGGGGSGGSGGGQGGNAVDNSPANGGAGGSYGGGGGGGNNPDFNRGNNGGGGVGAVRIVWCISGVRGTPSFPSTNVGA